LSVLEGFADFRVDALGTVPEFSNGAHVEAQGAPPFPSLDDIAVTHDGPPVGRDGRDWSVVEATGVDERVVAGSLVSVGRSQNVADLMGGDGHVVDGI
jgi:hypothetical protein